jgi:Fibronectin type III domain
VLHPYRRSHWHSSGSRTARSLGPCLRPLYPFSKEFPCAAQDHACGSKLPCSGNKRFVFRLQHLFMVSLAGVSLLNFSALASAPTPQGSLSLAWDPSPYPGVAGYRFYLGVNSEVYTNVIDVGNQTSITISNLVPGATYFFAVTAYDLTGLESTFSGEIAYTVPSSASLPPSAVLCAGLERNALGQVTVTGTAPPGWVYDVLASQDLSSWLLIGTVTVDPAGKFQLIDPISGVNPTRYYRLRQRATQPTSSNMLPQDLRGSG